MNSDKKFIRGYSQLNSSEKKGMIGYVVILRDEENTAQKEYLSTFLLDHLSGNAGFNSLTMKYRFQPEITLALIFLEVGDAIEAVRMLSILYPNLYYQAIIYA